MIDFFKKIFLLVVLMNFSLIIPVNSEEIKKIKIIGNDRISDETIKMFSSVKLNQILSNNDLDKITKNLYESNFFENITISFEKGILNIEVVENPIIGSIDIRGIKSKTIKENLYKSINLKSKSSFNEFLLGEDREIILNELKGLGYYSAAVEPSTVKQSKNIVDLIYEINLGNKARSKD